MDALGKVIVVCGPTATGKSALALSLARRLGGELVNADSMQVYKGLTVGTAAVTEKEANGVALHLTGTLPPEESFSVAGWAAAAEKVIDDILSRGALPIVCGGTGLYIQSLVKGIKYHDEEANPALRQKLDEEWGLLGGQAMLEKLKSMDAERAAYLHVNDKKRILRAIETTMGTGLTAQQRNARSLQGKKKYSFLIIGLNFNSREDLYSQCNTRVLKMMDDGLLDEARLVWQNRESYRTAAQAIGYKEFFGYFENTQKLEECVQKLQQATRNYAKRQLTWFSKMQNINWLTADDDALCENAEKLIEAFLKQ